MPYKASQIPSGTEKVPKHGQAIFRSAFNAAFEKYGEERAHAIAWSAVKTKYKKKGDRWVSKDGYAVMHRLEDYNPDQPRGKSVPGTNEGSFTSASGAAGGGGELHLTKAEGLSQKTEISRAIGFGQGIEGIAGGLGGAEGELGAGTFGKSEPAGGAKASPGVPKELVKAIEDHVGGMGGEFGQHGSADLTRWLMLARKDQMLKLIDEMPANKRPALLLHKGDEKAGMPSVWLLGWSATEQTDIHDHVRSEVGISVLRGNIANEWNHPPPGYLDAAKSPDGLRMPVNKDTLPEGTTVQLEAPYIHLMRGTSPSKASGQRDISVHAYHPPLKQMHYFKSRDGALRYDGDWDEDRPPSEYSTRDCACCSLLDEAAGHPFRGNQYTTGESGGEQSVGAGTTGERAATGEHGQKVKAFLSLSSAKSVIRSAIDETIKAGEHIAKHESEIAVSSGILAALTSLGAPAVPAAICATIAGYAVHRVANKLGIDAGAAHRLLKAATGGLRNMSERARRSGMHGGAFPEQALGFGDADDSSVSRSLRLLDDALNRYTLDELDKFIEEYESGRFHRDEETGHPFRGNQYTTGESGGGKAEETGRERGGGEEVHPGKGYSKEARVDEKGIIHTENVDDAARALSEGRKVELSQPRQVSTLLDKLGEIAQGAIAKGEKAPNFNLCDVSVKGTNLFCAETKGFTRIEMPQLEDTKGFLDYLKARGHAVKDDEEYAAHLRATQNELKGAQVAALANFMETGIGKDGKVDKEAAAKLQDRPIVISNDNYILDGHHTWAAKIGMDARDNILADDKKMNVRRVDTDIITLLYAADDFTGGKGKKSAKDRAMMDQKTQCPECYGSGLDLEGDDCDECDGTGYVDDTEDDDIEDNRRRQTDSVRLTEGAVFIKDKDGKTVRRTKDGYLVANARIARTGIQLYDGAEIGMPNMGTVRVYRPESEVFSTKAMHSLANKPITLNHPPVMVDANNWDEYAVGHIGEEVTRDGDSVRVPLVIMDSKAIEAYEKHGVKELSVGYSTDLRWGKGRTPDGEIYDAKQTAIRGNHLAVVPAARGGSRLKIGDDHQKGATDMVKILVDGQSIGFEDELAAKHVQNYLGSLQTQLDAAKKKNGNNNNREGSAAEEEQESEKEERGEKDAAFAAMKGEVAALKKQLADALAKTDPKAIDAEAERRIDLLLKADAVMEGKADFKGKPDTEIVRTVVMAKMGDAAKDLSDAEMVGAFKILTANLKPRSGTDRLADSLSLLGHGGGDQTNSKTIRDKAYADYVANTSNAWKNPRGAAQ